MDLISQFRWSIFGKLLGIIILAIINAPIVNLHIVVENTSVSHIPTNNLGSPYFHPNQSNDKIQLKIIEKEIEQFEVILVSHNNRRKRNTLSPFIPISNSSEFSNIENEIKNIPEQLSSLANSTSLNMEDKLKISVLETKMKNVQNSLDKLKTDLREKDEKNEIQKRNVLRTLETTIINSIVQSILLRQFLYAEIQLQSVDDATIRTVFKTIQQADNYFDLLATFGDSIQNFELKFKIYEILYLKLKSNDTIDTGKLLSLAQNLKKISTNNSTDVIASKAKLLICNLWNENQRSVVEAISAAFFNDSLQKMAKEQSADIFLNCDYTNRYRNMSDTYKKVIENVFDKVTTQDILDKAFCNLQPDTNIAESAVLNEAVFDKLESTDKLSTNDVIPLARHVKTVMESSNYRNLDPEFRNRQENIKSKLPISVKNLVFSSVICLKNSRYNEYLYAGTNQEVIDAERRLVFTWIPQNKTDSTFKWHASFRDDYGINLVNAAFNEYLFACNNNRYDDRRRYVLSWRKEGGGSMQDSTWNLEVVDKDTVRIKNRFHNEYLYADIYEQRDENRRHVFTYIPQKKTYDSEWKIIDCSE